VRKLEVEYGNESKLESCLSQGGCLRKVGPRARASRSGRVLRVLSDVDGQSAKWC
jgi:hypothetical protein